MRNSQAFLTSPALGALSDMLGRKYIFITRKTQLSPARAHILVLPSLGCPRFRPLPVSPPTPARSVVGTASPYAALGLGASLDVHLVLLGLTGTFAATFPLAFAYISDVNTASLPPLAVHSLPLLRRPLAPCATPRRPMLHALSFRAAGCLWRTHRGPFRTLLESTGEHPCHQSPEASSSHLASLRRNDRLCRAPHALRLSV